MAGHLKSGVIEISPDVSGDDLIDFPRNAGNHSDVSPFQHSVKQIADPGANDRGRVGFQKDVQTLVQGEAFEKNRIPCDFPLIFNVDDQHPCTQIKNR
ncbi:MAG: hypothetical protein PVG49_03375 [Desulfobacteraceae bacterium]|jgi:hypothetical protein